MADMTTTDKWQRALAHLGLGDQDFGPTCYSSYADLAKGWRGAKALPSEQALEAAWAEIRDLPAGPPRPLTAEELYDMLAAKRVLAAEDRPRPKAG